MKRLFYMLIAVTIIFTIISNIYAASGKDSPSIIVDTPKVKMSKKAQVIIKGENFMPGQEVRILFTDADGVKTDIGNSLKPSPVADQNGSFNTTWSCGRYISKKLVKKGVSTLTITDVNYILITEGFVAFYIEGKAK